MFPMFTRHRGYKNYHSVSRQQSHSLFSFFSHRNKIKRRDFWHKSFRNPFLSTRHLPKRTRALKTKISIGLLCLASILGLLFFHPYFNINKIELNGLEKISANQLNDLVREILDKNRLWIFKGNNFFWVNSNLIDKKIKERYSVEDLKIQTRLPNRLKITLKEKMARLLVQNTLLDINNESKYSYYSLDAEGKIIQKIGENEINNPAFLTLLLIKFQDLKDLKINGQVISPATVEFLLFWQQKIPEKTKVNLASASLADQEGRVVHLTAAEGWKIYVDRQNDWEKQLQVLTIFLRDKIKEDRKNLRYIDVRYENRSYYQ